MPEWKEALAVLERDEGAAWKLVFMLLAKGRLFDDAKERPLRITGRGVIRAHFPLFRDTYDDAEMRGTSAARADQLGVSQNEEEGDDNDEAQDDNEGNERRARGNG